ncbi:MAG: zf-HC2 domain-containing protein [Gemmatimonadaceae bacterium]
MSMNDCQNVAVREVLPDLVHGLLPDIERVRVLMHVRECEDCTDELSIIRAVITVAVAPQVDVVAISAAIPAYSSYSKVVPRSRFHVAHLRLAAALLLGAAGVSAVVVQHERSGTKAASAVSQTAPVASTNLSHSGVALVGTADLSDEHLAQLIHSMAHIDAAPPAEPEPITPAAFEADAS